MRGAARGKDERAPVQRLDSPWLARKREVSVAQLAVPTRAPRVRRSVVRQSQRVEVAARDAQHPHVAERHDAPWRGVSALLAVPQLPVLAISKREELAVRSEHARVPAAHNTHGLNLVQARDEPGHRLGAALAMAQLPKASRAPRVHLPSAADGRAMVRAAFELPQHLTAQGIDGTRAGDAAALPVPKLPMLSVTPRVGYPALTQGCSVSPAA